MSRGINFVLSRRSFLRLAGVGIAGLILSDCNPQKKQEVNLMTNSTPEWSGQMENQKNLVFVGTYTSNLGFVDGKAKGVYAYWFEPSDGKLKYAYTLEGLENPSFLAVHPNGRWLYVVSELMEFQGMPGGGLSALEIEAGSGNLKLMNQQPTYGGAPCHVSLDHSGRFVLVANYMGGNVSIYPIQPDGSLGGVSDRVQHTGKGLNPNRQEAPHAHSINPDPSNTFALVCDLGLDKVMIYRLDLENGKLLPHTEPFASLHPGAGPRHLDFHPNGHFVYVINELDATLTAFTWEAQTGQMRELQTVSTLPRGFSGPKSCADVHVHPNGKFLYGSNRGHDSLAIFAVDETTGRLELIGHESTRGKTPRNFVIDPSGDYLLVANQDSSTVAVFRINLQSGKLDLNGDLTDIPTPVCLKFLG